MNRRNFLGGVLALTAMPFVPKIIGSLPIIYGDNIHDDWAGLQAMLDGKPFNVDAENIIAKEGELSNGRFIISRGLKINPKRIFYIHDCVISQTEDFQGNCMIHLDRDCSIDGSLMNIDIV